MIIFTDGDTWQLETDKLVALDSVTVRNTSISLLLLTIMWVLWRPPIERWEPNSRGFIRSFKLASYKITEPNTAQTFVLIMGMSHCLHVLQNLLRLMLVCRYK